MPPGIPVATVAIDGAVNAALLAAEILAVSDDAIAEKLAAKREAGKQKVLAKNRAIESSIRRCSSRVTRQRVDDNVCSIAEKEMEKKNGKQIGLQGNKRRIRTGKRKLSVEI